MTDDIPIRGGSNKVRSGCITCKRRRIKCDEAKPACTRCIRSRRCCEGYASVIGGSKYVQYVADIQIVQKPPQRDDRDKETVVVSEVFQRMSLKRQSPPDDTVPISEDAVPTPLEIYSSLARPLGGFRGDPFNVYPIESTRSVQESFDHVLWTHFRIIKGPMRSSYLDIIMHDKVYFEALIAFSKITVRYSMQPKDRVDDAIRAHIASVLRGLQKRIASETDCASDNVLLTIYVLLQICQAAGDYEAFLVHLHGLKLVVARRPRLDADNLRGFMKARVMSSEMFAAYVEYIHTNLLQPGQGFAGFLQYPSIPLSACHLQKINRIPETWRPLARTGKVSLQTIDFLAGLPEHMAAQFSPSSADSQKAFCALRFIENIDSAPFAPCRAGIIDTELRLASGI